MLIDDSRYCMIAVFATVWVLWSICRSQMKAEGCSVKMNGDPTVLALRAFVALAVSTASINHLLVLGLNHFN